MIRAARLRRSIDIASVRARGRAVRRSAFALRALPGSATLRLAVSAPRSIGGAVRRNRARRRLREAFRISHAPAPLDLLVTARPPAIDRPFAELVAEARSALEEAAR